MIHKTKGKITDIDVQYLKDRYLYGINLVNYDRTPWPDQPYEQAINVALSKFQDLTQVNVIAEKVTREAHDYYAGDYVRWAFLHLFKRPVMSVEKIEVKFPINEDYIEWPIDWVKLNKESGQIQLIPTAGSLSNILLGSNAGLLPLLQGGYSYVPQMFHITYTPGLPDNNVPMTIIDAICKMAAIEVLTLASDTIYQPGARSISVSKDGVTHSLSLINDGRLPAVFASKIGFWMSQLYGTADHRMWDGTSGDLGAIRYAYRGIAFTVA